MQLFKRKHKAARSTVGLFSLSVFLLLSGTLFSSVTISTGEVQLYYTGLMSSGNYYSEKDEPLRNTSLTRGSIHNLRIKGQIVTNDLWFDSTFNVDFNNPDLVNFQYNRLLFSVYKNDFYFGSLPLHFSSMVNNTNNIYGILWQAPLMPENKLRAGVFGAGLREGFDSPFYPTYLYGLALSTGWKDMGLTLFYMKLSEQEQALRYNSLLQPGFTPSHGSLNKLTARNSKGTIRKNISLDLDTDPVLEISVVDTGDKNIAWELEVDDGNGRVSLQYITRQAGVFRYDLRSPTGWSGLKSINLYLSFYNSPYDLSDNSIYVDYLKIENSAGVLYEYEDFSDWIIPDDVKVEVLDKKEAVSTLPRAYFPYQAQFYGFSFAKTKGNTKGALEFGLNNTETSPVEKKNGYYVKADLDHVKGGLEARVKVNKVSRDFDLSPVSVIEEPSMDLKDNDRFFLGPTTFFGDWVQEYVELVAMPDKIKLVGEGGAIYKYFDVDLEKYPVFSLKVGGNADTDFEWAVYAEDESSSFQLDYSSRTGIFTYDLKQITGWSGKKHFRIRIKKGKADLYLYWAKFWRTGVSRRYGLGPDTQILEGSLGYRASSDLNLTTALKVWDERLSSYHFSMKGTHDIYRQGENLVQINAGLSKNRGMELENVEDYPAFFEYFNASAGLSYQLKKKRFEIPLSSLDYEINFHDRENASLTSGRFHLRYLLGVWFGYSLRARSGRIVDWPLQDYTHDFTIEKELPAWFDSLFSFRYKLTRYINVHEKECEYLTNLFEISLRRQSARFQNTLDLEYRIGEFGKAVKYRYNSFVLTLGVKFFL